MSSDRKNGGDIKVEGGIKGDGIIVGHGDNTVQVTKISVETQSETLAEAFAELLRQVRVSQNISQEEKRIVEQKAKAVKSTLESSDPDLGRIQEFKKFLLEKGGAITTAASSFFSHPAVVAIMSTALKKLLE